MLAPAQKQPSTRLPTEPDPHKWTPEQLRRAHAAHVRWATADPDTRGDEDPDVRAGEREYMRRRHASQRLRKRRAA